MIITKPERLRVLSSAEMVPETRLIVNEYGCEYSDRIFITGPDRTGQIVVTDKLGVYVISKPELYYLKPMLMVEGTPLYSGDKVYCTDPFVKGFCTLHHYHGKDVVSIVNEIGRIFQVHIETVSLVPEDRVKYINVYSDVDGHNTEEIAKSKRMSGFVGCIKVTFNDKQVLSVEKCED